MCDFVTGPSGVMMMAIGYPEGLVDLGITGKEGTAEKAHDKPCLVEKVKSAQIAIQLLC